MGDISCKFPVSDGACQMFSETNRLSDKDLQANTALEIAQKLVSLASADGFVSPGEYAALKYADIQLNREYIAHAYSSDAQHTIADAEDIVCNAIKCAEGCFNK